MLPKYSVLMAVYKNDLPHHFLSSVESVRTQIPAPDQVVIVRDGPVPDELQTILSHFERDAPEFFSVLSLPVNGGLAMALNAGLSVCRNDLVMRQDADDISEVGRVEKQLQVMVDRPDVTLVGSWYDQYDYDMQEIVGVRMVPELHDDIVRYGRYRTPFNHASIFFRKSAVQAVGGYPDIKGLSEDWWLALRLIKAGKILYNIQESLVRVRGGDDFFSRRRGFAYMRQEVTNQLAMYRAGLLSGRDLMVNFLVRTPSRLLPAKMLEFLYNYIIRRIK